MASQAAINEGLHRLIRSQPPFNMDGIRYLVENKGADINSISAAIDKRPLLIAAVYYRYSYGDATAVNYLIERGANVNIVRESDSQTPLLHAINAETDSMLIRLLISKGANVNHQDNNGYTPLHMAVVYNNEIVIEILINAGADRSIKNEDGHTAEEMARHRHKDEIADFIRDYQPLPDLKEPDLDYDTDY